MRSGGDPEVEGGQAGEMGGLLLDHPPPLSFSFRLTNLTKAPVTCQTPGGRGNNQLLSTFKPALRGLTCHSQELFIAFLLLLFLKKIFYLFIFRERVREGEREEEKH